MPTHMAYTDTLTHLNTFENLCMYVCISVHVHVCTVHLLELCMSVCVHILTFHLLFFWGGIVLFLI